MTRPTSPSASTPTGPSTETKDGPVAIVGIGCRYADARGPDEMWEIIRSGRNTVRDVPAHRVELGYDIEHFYDPRPRTPGRISSKKGGFLEHPELFDPAAFGIAPRDALTMDPQQRLMVEVTWDALEDAGIAPASVAGERCAVILGYMAEDYSRERTGVLGEEAVFRGHDVFTVGGMSHAVLSGRIAFLLGVTGPSFTLDTACSSSLIATHLACQSLRRGEADMALAGGANLFLSPEGNIALSRSGMLSMSGSCRAFDAGADGFVRAEGAGVVVLKRLADALEQNDPIYAVIRGSGISTDGRDGGHMMAPGRKGQAQAMRDAYAQAGVDPAQIQYVETHGTGTMIGDPVEIGALADVMGPGRDPARPLRVASIKGNLGHTESASGVAGLIQACLAIHHRTLPKQLHFETPNPAIPWSDIPIRVQTELEPWPEPGPALVGVNSFGISGTNAHVVLESPPDHSGPSRSATAARRRALVLPLSAHDPRALNEGAHALLERLDAGASDEAHDVLHTLGTRVERRAHRLAVSGRSVDALRDRLRAHLANQAPPGVSVGSTEPDLRPEIVMVFPGQGSQWLGMGAALMHDEPVFASAIDRIDAAYSEHVAWSLRERLETTPADVSARPDRDWTRRLDELQPVLVGFEIALAELWQSWGVVPDRVIGQSMGEIAAAHVAGALDLPTVARLACHRGRIVARAKGQGGMAIVSLSRDDVERRLAARAENASGRLEIAGVNAPSVTIVAGDRAPLADWVDALHADDVFARMLDVDFASHCFHMDPLLEPFEAGLGTLSPSPTRVPLHSTVDGEVRSGTDLDAAYWVRNLRSAVAFDAAVENATAAGGRLFLELSAHPTLSRALAECAQATGRSIHFVGSLNRDESAEESLARGIAELFVAGASIDFARFGPDGRVTRLPLYAYQRERYWFSDRTRLDTFRPQHPLLREPIDPAHAPDTRIWTFRLDADTAGFANDLLISGHPRLPVSTFLELALAVGDALSSEHRYDVEALQVHRALEFDDDAPRVVQVTCRQLDDGRRSLAIASRVASSDGAGTGRAWTGHATATLVVQSEIDSTRTEDEPLAIDALRSLGRGRFEDAMSRCRVAFGSRTRSLRDLLEVPDSAGRSSLGARLQLPRSVETEWQAYHAHPALIETALQVGGLLSETGDHAIELDRIESASIRARLGSEVYVRLVARDDTGPSPSSTLVYDCRLFDEDGEPVGRIDGIRAHVLPAIEGDASDPATRLAGVRWASWTPPPSAVDATAPVSRWLLVSDDPAQAGLVAAELRKRDAEIRLCNRVEQLAALAPAMTASDGAWGLIVLAWGDANDDGAEEGPLRASRIERWAEAIRNEAADAHVVWIATRGSLPAADQDVDGSVSDRRLANEIDAFTTRLELDRCRFYDASAVLDERAPGRLATLLGSEHGEQWIAQRGEEWFVPRLAPRTSRSNSVRVQRVIAGTQNVAARRVEGLRRNHLGELEPGVDLCLAPEDPVGPRDVRVAVEYSGLGRLDVLDALAPRAHRDGTLGHDFVGRVIATGDDVETTRVGDRVIGVARGSLARRISVDGAKVVPVKTNAAIETDARVAVLPELVAHHALRFAARVVAGDAILVDAGSGPIARALIRRGVAMGARVRAVAHSDRSASRLARLGVPVERADAEGSVDQRVSVVVTDASGRRARALAARLDAGGCYVDLRRTNAHTPLAIDPVALEPNRTLVHLDTIGLFDSEPALARRILADIAADLPSTPPAATIFPIAEVDRALRYVAQNRHEGGVAIDFADVDRADACAAPAEREDWQRFDRIVIDGDAVETIEALRSTLPSVSAASIELAGTAPTTASAGTDARTLHLYVSTERNADRRAARLRALASPATHVFISIRADATGDEAADRSWIGQLWLDRLVRPDARVDAAVRWQELSVPATASATAIVDVVADALRSPDESILVDTTGLEGGAGAPAFTSTLPSAVARHDGLLELDAPERRAQILEIVLAELGTVLGLDESRSEALAPTRRLDSLGLDSLMSLELFVGLGRTLGLEIERDWFASIPSLAEIAHVLADRLPANEATTEEDAR